MLTELKKKRIAQARSLFEVTATYFKMNIVKSLMQNYFYFKPTCIIEYLESTVVEFKFT